EREWSPSDARKLAEGYAHAMSREYQAATDPAIAVSDIGTLELMRSDGRVTAITMANPAPTSSVTGVEGATELKIFLRGERLVLSDFMPILEDAGLRVLAVKPFEVGAGRDGAAAPEATIWVFAVQDAQGRPLDVE